MPGPRRLFAAAVGAALVAAPAAVLAPPATADHTDLPTRSPSSAPSGRAGLPDVDWPSPTAPTPSSPVPGSATPLRPDLQRAAGHPAAAYDYLYKVRAQRLVDENYGARDVRLTDGNIRFALAGAARAIFTYDDATHRGDLRAGPTSPAGTPPSRPRPGRGLPARDLTREHFYFVMADRFANGTTPTTPAA